MFRFFAKLTLILICGLLIGCGGGGGGGGTPTIDTSDGVNTTTLDLSRSSLTFNAVQFGDLPPSQSVRVSFTGNVSVVNFGLAPGVALPEWFDLQTNQETLTATVSVTTTNLAPGTYTLPFRAVSQDSNGTTLDTAEVTVTYIVGEGIVMATDPASIAVDMAPKQDPVVETFTLTGEGLDFRVSAISNRLSVSPMSGVIPAGGVDIELTITSETALEPNGGEPLIVQFADRNNTLNRATLSVEVTSVDGLFSDAKSLIYYVQENETQIQSDEIDLQNFQSSPDINWTATTNQPWLSTSASTGTLAANNDFNNDVDFVTITSNPMGLSTGTYKGVVTFAHDVSAQTLKIPVTLVVAKRRLISETKGVALSNLSDVSRSVAIQDSFGANIPWTAQSNASWLNVTASGAAGDPLILTADTTGLSLEQIFEAEVEVQSSLSDISNVETIAVGLWNSGATVERVSVQFPEFSIGRGNVVAVDPVRPLVYSIEGANGPDGGAVSSTIKTYNAYSGDVVGTAVDVRLDAESSLVASDDGKYLYVFPYSGTREDAVQYERFDLPELSNPTLFSNPIDVTLIDMAFTRINGLPFIVSGAGGVIDATTGAYLGDASVRQGGVSTNAIGTACFNRFDDEDAVYVLTCMQFVGSGVAGDDIGRLNSTQAPFGDISDYAVSGDGETVYFKATNIVGLRTADLFDSANTVTFEGDNLSRVTLGADGTIYSLGTVGEDFTSNNSVLAFNPDGTLIGTTNIGGDSPSNLFVSADGGRVVVVQDTVLETTDQSLEFLDSP